MPVEGQWRRVNTPLSLRDKRLLGAVLALVAIATIGLAVAYATHTGSSSRVGCVVVDVPSTMGGTRLRTCGADARTFCRKQGAVDARIRAACLLQGYPVGLPAPPATAGRSSTFDSPPTGVSSPSSRRMS